MTLGWAEHLRESTPIARHSKGTVAWSPTVDDGFVISSCLGRLRERALTNFPTDFISPSSSQDVCLVTPSWLETRVSNRHITRNHRILEDRIRGEHITWRLFVFNDFTLHWIAAVVEFGKRCPRRSVAGINGPSLNVLRTVQVLRFNHF